MRIAAVLLLAAVLVFQGVPIGLAETTGRSDQGIQWMTDFDQALAQGRTNNKPIFIDFFNPN